MLNRNWVLAIFTVLLLIATFFIFKSVLTYLAVSAVLTLIGRPLYRQLLKIRIKQWKLPSGLASLLTLVSFFVITTIFLKIFIPSIVEETKVIAQIDPKDILKSLEQPIADLEDVVNQFSDEPFSLNKYISEKLKSVIDYAAVSNWLKALTGFTGNLFISFFAISFITFFFLKDSKVIMQNIISVIPTDYRDEGAIIQSQVKEKLTRYFVGICIEILLVFTLNAIGLYFVGIKSFFIIALFAGIINVIPYVGPLMGIVFGLIITLTTCYNLPFYTELMPLMLKVGVAMMITQLLDNILLQPIIYANSVNAHPLEIFLVILIAGNIYGIAGMVLAIPCYSVIRVLIKEIRVNSGFLNNLYS